MLSVLFFLVSYHSCFTFINRYYLIPNCSKYRCPLHNDKLTTRNKTYQSFVISAKRPSELLTARRPSNLDGTDRRKSNASNKGKATITDVDTFESNV